jgi:plastocyanin
VLIVSNPPEDTSKQNPSRTRVDRRKSLPRSVASVAVIVAVMMAAAIALTLRRSSPTQPATAGTVASTAVAAPGATSGPVDVAIMDFAFAPETVTVKAGTTVTWTNHDSEAHTVRTTKSTAVKSDVLATDATFSFTFTTPGEYAYHCSIHPEMHGTVVVTG